MPDRPPRAPRPVDDGPGAPGVRPPRFRSAILSIAALALCGSLLQDAMKGPAWVSAGCAVVIAAALTTSALFAFRALGPRDSNVLAAGLYVSHIVLVLAGAVILPVTNWSGWAALCAGALLLSASLSRPIWATALVVGTGAALALAGEALSGTSGVPLLATALGLVGVCLGAYGQRAGTIRRAQEAELVRKSRQLIDEQARAAAETARAAALEERARIARDLHDVLAHSLGGLVVQLDAAAAQVDAGVPQEILVERLRAARGLAAEGLEEARSAVRELRDDEGETGATTAIAPLARVAGGAVARQIGLELEVLGEPLPIPSGVSDAFAAVLRESVTNIQKHAPGERAVATVVFSALPGGAAAVRLEVVNATSRARPGVLAETGGGFGIDGMRTRMAEAGGALEAGRPSDGRFLVQASWPADQEGIT